MPSPFLSRALALTCALSATLFTACSHAGWLDSTASSSKSSLTLATWNLDWLMTPRAHDDMAPRCTSHQPASDERTFPCTPGRPQPPSRTQADFDALAHTAAQLRDEQQADVVALQEVDGPEAARMVFSKGWKLDCFVNRAHPQKVGFAIRDGLPYRCNGDLAALDVDGATRAGADITLYPGTPQEVRLLAVHLKSGCFDGRLDRHFSPCERLRQQAPIVEAWIDQRVREGKAFAVLGDFNRRLEKDARYPAGPDEAAPINLMQAWSDNEPPGAILTRATEGQAYVPCDAGDHHKAYIDDILIDTKLAARNKNRRFARLPFNPQDRGRELSDHCPVVWGLSP
ncbi:endonuclease/exonuclease/phosphatase family protein [Aquabacterium sp. NJ1]|uniref:endonuclease/exonuclease/phosphatase family protein n=1 Tax=Aquabacterium sp. NJ1 TaxID=1538295 RepID=UPI000690E660|nr:endonuclease/exonuclease/phosphatase family protein [Aquabacterium sp. NJ1]